MTIIPGAFYQENDNKISINSPIISPNGEIIGKQEKIHPYDYEKDIVNPEMRLKFSRHHVNLE